MNNINGFLEKFLILDNNNNLKISIILEVIKKYTKIELKKENLDIKGDNMRLDCNPVFRSEIFMNKNKIEQDLKSKKIFLKII